MLGCKPIDRGTCGSKVVLQASAKACERLDGDRRRVTIHKRGMESGCNLIVVATLGLQCVMQPNVDSLSMSFSAVQDGIGVVRGCLCQGTSLLSFHELRTGRTVATEQSVEIGLMSGVLGFDV